MDLINDPNNSNQSGDAPVQTSTMALNNKAGPNDKPFWKTDAFVVLMLVIFWPVGLFLMWKYASWKKWAKGLLTAFLLIGAIPLLFIWTLLFGIKGYSFVDNLINPRVINKSKLYICIPLNSEWGKCTNTKYDFSFEYPAKWNYIDLKPEGIGFSPSDKNMMDKFIISMGSPAEWKSEADAIKFAKGYSGLSSRQETTIGGLYATKDYDAFSGEGIIASSVIVDGIRTYKFMSIPDKLKEAGLSLSNSELQTIFDHMVSSFIKER